MYAIDADRLEMSHAWIEEDGTARWRSASGHGPANGARASGSSIVEVEPGCRLPLHTDSAEETIVVFGGSAEVQVGDAQAHVGVGGLVLVPADVPHEVRSRGGETLRFAAVYAEPEVVTRYADEVQPDGSRERHPVS